jgi:curli biogenesis system outer membrane secretion channel CsgG
MKRNIMILTILCVIIGSMALPAVGAVNLHLIAVLPFDDGSIKKTWGENYSLGKGVADELVTALLATNRFRLIERTEIDRVLEEQNLGKDGIINPQTAAKIGKILGAQYLVIGRITEFSTKEDDDILANPNHNNPMGMRIERVTSRVAIDARMVDAATAEIISSVTGTGKKKTVNLGMISKQGLVSFGDKDFEKTDLAKALRQAVNLTARQLAIKAYERMAPLTLTGMIAYVSNQRIIINIGRKHGVVPGMVFKVDHKLETLKDPVTGQVIDIVTEPVAEILVTEVKEKAATCVVVTKLNNEYKIAVSDPVESKEPVKPVLPELPPLAEEEGRRKGREFRFYAERMVLGEYTDESLPKEDETKDSALNFIGAQAVLGRFKLMGERTFDGEIKDPTRKLSISEYKLGYNLNPVQDMQVELFVSKFNLKIESGGDELLDCSSWIFGADMEYEMLEKTYFELSYGYGASIDYEINGKYQAGGNLGIIKTKLSYCFSSQAAAYAQYRSYLMKFGDDQDLSGITVGLAFNF